MKRNSQIAKGLGIAGALASIIGLGLYFFPTSGGEDSPARRPLTPEKEARIRIYENEYGEPESLLRGLRDLENGIRVAREQITTLRREMHTNAVARKRDRFEAQAALEREEEIRREIAALENEIDLSEMRIREREEDYRQWLRLLK